VTPARFVVGTGRCGSTLLSLMLAEHRDVVSIHEFFTGLDGGRRFQSGPVAGARVAELLDEEQPVTTRVLALGYTSDEIRYPFGAPHARWRQGDALPWLLVTMASRLSERPDELHEAMVAFAAGLPEQPMVRHYDALLDWLAHVAGGSVWIERSGSSIDYVSALAELWPGARFVHLHRDGREAALSIRAHPFFRLALALVFDLFPEGDGDDDTPLIRHVVETPPPLWCAGRFWSDQVLRGYRALPGLDAAQWLDVRFEDLLAAPAEVLSRIAAFFELAPDDDFLARASSLVRGHPPSRFDDLSPVEQDELAEACRPGMVLLGRAPG
jgi:Sulfotransferase family